MIYISMEIKSMNVFQINSDLNTTKGINFHKDSILYPMYENKLQLFCCNSVKNNLCLMYQGSIQTTHKIINPRPQRMKFIVNLSTSLITGTEGA